MRVVIIGGGAAGFFAAISAKTHHPDAEVIILEKTQKLLSKVKISGGGRCNVTNACTDVRELLKAYPRGEGCLKRGFKQFNTRHTIEWFTARGVELVTQEDGCIFPASQDSQTIIDCLIREAQQLGIEIRRKHSVVALSRAENKKLRCHFYDDKLASLETDYIIMATGGAPKRSTLEWLETIPQTIADPVPSLFTFNLPNDPITELMGVVVEHTQARITGAGLLGDGPLLITHWGLSGPAILKLSAFGARWIYEHDYRFIVQINWVNEKNQEMVKSALSQIITEQGKKQLTSFRPYKLPQRLWIFLLNKYQLSSEKRWGELSKRDKNQLIEALCNDHYTVDGQTRFKEEFVTCGGIDFADVDPRTLMSTQCRNLYFAGEVLDIDGITGGYNFQAAWTTGYIAGQLTGSEA